MIIFVQFEVLLRRLAARCAELESQHGQQCRSEQICSRMCVLLESAFDNNGYVPDNSHEINLLELRGTRGPDPRGTEPRKMEHALAELALPCLTLKGTVFERRRVIRSFHSEGWLGYDEAFWTGRRAPFSTLVESLRQENKILLLSLERSPSGMNLVCRRLRQGAVAMSGSRVWRI